MNIRQLIQEGESDRLDFKERISSAQKIAKTMVSFANTRGGILLIGIRDNGTIRGVDPKEEQFLLEQAAGFFSKPEIHLTISELTLEQKTILKVEIAESEQKPHYALGEDTKWWVYIRVKDKSVLASKTVVDVLRRESKNEGTLIQFTNNEKRLLQYLEKTERITLKEYAKLCNIAPWRARKILVNLVTAGIIRIHTIEKTDFYTLS